MLGIRKSVSPWSCVIFIIHFHACQSWTLFSCVFQWLEIAQFVTRIALFGLWLKIRSMWCWGLFGLIWVFFSAIQRCNQNSPCFYLKFMFLNDCCQQKKKHPKSHFLIVSAITPGLLWFSLHSLESYNCLNTFHI